MKITSLLVEGAGRFGTAVALQGLGDGVNVLAANNEAGKSTLFRAIRACLFERHSTSNRHIQDLCTEGLSLPLTVKLGFAHGGHDYLVTKCFIRSASASLRRDGVEIARGRQADEELWDVLGIRPGSGRSVDEAVFGILWVSQRGSFATPDVSGGAAEALEAIVHEEVGALVGGERARKVLDALEQELQDQLTPTGRPRNNGPLGQAISRCEQFEKALGETTSLLRQVDQQLAALEDLEKERKSLSDPKLLEKARSDLAEASSALEVANNARSELAATELKEQVARGALEAAQNRLDELTACSRRIDETRRRETALVEELKESKDKATKAQAQLDAAQTEFAANTARAGEEAAAERALKLVQEASSGERLRDELTARRQMLETSARDMDRIGADLGANAATAERLAELDNLERQLGLLDAQLAAGATQLEVKVAQDSAVTVTVDGRDVTDQLVVPVTDRTVVAFGDSATITAIAPRGYGAEEQAERQRLSGKLTALLEAARVLTPEQFRQARARRIELESQLNGLTGQLKGLGLETKSLPSKVETAASELAAMDAATAAALEASGRQTLPKPEQLNAEADEIERRREQTGREQARLLQAIQAHNVAHSSASAAVSRAEATLDEVRKALAIDLTRLPDEQREEVISKAQASQDSAKQAHQLCAAALLHQREKAPTEIEVERLKTRCERLTESLQRLKDEASQLDGRIRNIEGQLTARGAEGLGEAGDALGQELDLARRDVDRITRRTDALSLLKTTIEQCYQQHRDRLNEPLLRHLQPFLSDLFADAKPELGERFELIGLRRGGPQFERFALLSDGTQEQIAVLVRLAMGSLLCERGEATPIILDDALVYSDDDRIERMFDALSRAAQKQQVIVLTCRLRAFATVGGRKLSLVAAA